MVAPISLWVFGMWVHSEEWGQVNGDSLSCGQGFTTDPCPG